MTLAIVCMSVCLVYAIAFSIGWRRAVGGRLEPPVAAHRRRLRDPLTARFQQWQGRAKMEALRQKHWSRLSLLILANNLVAVAFVSRTLYGVTLVLPLYLTWRQGLAQGAVVAQPSLRPRGSLAGVAVLEFGAYLLATALGVHSAVSVFVTRSAAGAMVSLAWLYPLIAGALAAGAWLEVRWLRAQIPAGVRIPTTLDVEQLRARALEILGSQRTGRPSN